MFELGDYEGKLCSGKTSYEFILKKQVELNLEKIVRVLKQKKIKIEIETPFMLVLEVDSTDMTLFKRGKILVKGVSDGVIAKKKAKQLLELLK